MKRHPLLNLLLLTALLTTFVAPERARAVPDTPGDAVPNIEDRLRRQLTDLQARLASLPQPTSRQSATATTPIRLVTPAALPIRSSDAFIHLDALRADIGSPAADKVNAAAVADLSDPSNPINAYTPYALIAGRSAVDLGLVYSGGLVGPGTFDAVRFCPACWDTRYYSRGTSNAAAVSNALLMADSNINSTLGLVTSLTNGNWNQYLGALPNAGGWNASFGAYDPFYGGAGNGYTGSPAFIQSVVGYNPSSPYNFTTQFLMNMNSLSTPWTGFNYGFGGWGVQRSEAAPASLIDQLAPRFTGLGAQQETLYFANEDLGNLRSESNTILIYLMFTDPWYLYYDYELRAYLTSIYTTRSSYATVTALAAEIAAWDDGSVDDSVLQERHTKRMNLEAWYTYLEYEVLYYLYVTPGALNWVLDVTQFLGDRLFLAWQRDDATQWFADWQTRWLSAYADAPEFAALESAVAALDADFPAFAEYMALNQQVRNLTLTFENEPAVQNFAANTEALFADQAAADQIDAEYNAYLTRMRNALRSVSFDAGLERYYDELNGLVLADDLYQLLATVQYNTILLVDDFQRQVHDAVYACLFYLGNQCNPYTYPDVAALYNQTFVDLMELAGAFYEGHALFWWVFYGQDSYRTLEQTTLQELGALTTSIAPELGDARSDFKAAVAALPQVAELRADASNLVAALRGRDGAASVTTSAAADELDQALTRMSELVVALTAPAANPTPTPALTPDPTPTPGAGQSLFLPVAIR